MRLKGGSSLVHPWKVVWCQDSGDWARSCIHSFKKDPTWVWLFLKQSSSSAFHGGLPCLSSFLLAGSCALVRVRA